MRSSTLILAGPLAASAQVLSTITGRVQTATISTNDVLYTTTWTYSNPATNFLTLTNSEGVVTGLPSNTAYTLPAGEQPQAVTSQPSVATIPAGLPTGVTYVPYNASGSLTSFQVSVGSSTTVVLGGGGVATDASVTEGSVPSGSSSAGGSGSGNGGSGSGNGGSGSGSGNGNSGSDSSNADSSASSSASASQSGNAASSVQVAGAGIGLFAFIAALL